MSRRFKIISASVAAFLMGSLFGGCGLFDSGARIWLAILNEELWG